MLITYIKGGTSAQIFFGEVVCNDGSTLTVVRFPGQVKCVFGQVKTAPNLSDRASENDSVISSIPEEQND